MNARDDQRQSRQEQRDANRRHETERRHAAERSGSSPTPTPTPRDVAERSSRSRGTEERGGDQEPHHPH
ncbi:MULTISPECIES: hypothetical protein [unclassified Streptomyces]|uniref:hypothetical protein n=1 Tax=unclassified Streptomyces TaxID=2593676 RepID=UPI0013192169|nr:MULTISPECIES: hypothetical protein [unclassified Streptomyces]QHC27953.1 hypothetical protein GR129_03010 [Streptomyces sp. HF10]WKE68034.1 hypothetical protein QHG49_02835 [Streptomyces sp. WP-1]